MKHRGLMLVVILTAMLALRPRAQDAPGTASEQCNGTPLQCAMQAGAMAYNRAKYEQAIVSFRRAIALDPHFVTAHLYLATTFANQCIPGVDTPENDRFCEQAIAEFSTVLAEPNADKAAQVKAAKSIASLEFQGKKFKDAKDYYRKVISLDPNDAEAYYGIGVIDWTESYGPRMEAYSRMGLNPAEHRLDPEPCEKLASEHLADVEEGMQML